MTYGAMGSIFAGALLGLLAAGAAVAMEMSAPETHGDLILSGGWARETIGPGTVSAAYLTIENRGDTDDALIDAVYVDAEATELHTHDMSGGVMRMRRTDQIAVPAGQTVSLEPGGDHIMLIGLAGPLAAGDEIDITLTFEAAGEITLTLPVGGGAMSH